MRFDVEIDDRQAVQLLARDARLTDEALAVRREADAPQIVRHAMLLNVLVLVVVWLALSALCAWGIVYFGLGLLAELFAPEDSDD